MWRQQDLGVYRDPSHREWVRDPAGIAITGIGGDSNHHQPSLRTARRILAAWGSRAGTQPCTIEAVAGCHTLRSTLSRREPAGWNLRGAGCIVGPVSEISAEAVTDAADRGDPRGPLLAELGPQPPDVDVDGARAAEVVVPPYLREQLLP